MSLITHFVNDLEQMKDFFGRILAKTGYETAMLCIPYGSVHREMSLDKAMPMTSKLWRRPPYYALAKKRENRRLLFATNYVNSTEAKFTRNSRGCQLHTTGSGMIRLLAASSSSEERPDQNYRLFYEVLQLGVPLDPEKQGA
jgi:hypothetical protein